MPPFCPLLCSVLRFSAPCVRFPASWHFYPFWAKSAARYNLLYFAPVMLLPFGSLGSACRPDRCPRFGSWPGSCCRGALSAPLLSSSSASDPRAGPSRISLPLILPRGGLFCSVCPSARLFPFRSSVVKSARNPARKKRACICLPLFRYNLLYFARISLPRFRLLSLQVL